MNTDAKVAGSIILLSAIILIAFSFLGGKSGSSQNPTPASSGKGEIVRSDSQATGPESAKVTFVEFGDFQCPACGAVYPVIHQLMSNYKDNVRFVFRNFPLPQHANAPLAAQFAEAAGQQGKFWDAYNKLYTTQNDWADSSSTNARAMFMQYAKDMGLDTAKVQSAIDSQPVKDKVARDMSDGDNLGIDSTPTIYINGKSVDPPFTYDNFKSKIDAALKK